MTSPNVVIISGASSGIGHCLAEHYARDGWHLGLIARRGELLEELKRELVSRYNVDVMVSVCDVSKKQATYDAIHDIIAHFGRVDCVIANAGISHSAPASDVPVQIVENTVKVNLFGAVYTAYAAIPTMTKQGFGHLVVISSLAGYKGLPEAGAYCASKAAVNAFYESMRLDLAAFNIDVSVIKPGFIVTPLTNRNQYSMPFLMSTEVGVSKIYRAIQKKKKVYAFPTLLAWFVQSLYFWPCWLYDAIFAGMSRKKKG